MKIKRVIKCFLLAAAMALIAFSVSACDQTPATITLDANGGSCAVSSISAAKGKTVSPPPAAVKEGSVFIGWYKSRTPSESELWNFAEHKVSGDMTLYAGFAAADGYVKISFETGADEGEALYSPSDLSIVAGGKVPCPREPKREGYVFKGWFLENGNQKWDFSEDVAERDMTLCALWSKIHTLSFDCGDNDLTLTDISVEDGGNVQVAAPYIKNKVFMGWYEDAGFKETFDLNTPVKEDTKLYGRWETATDAEHFIYDDYGQIYITGIKETFTGDKIVVPERIGDNIVTSVYINSEVQVDKIILPAELNSFSSNILPKNGYEVSSNSKAFFDYKDNLYRKLGGGRSELAQTADKKLIDLFEGARIGVNLSNRVIKTQETFIDPYLISDNFFIVKDEYYESIVSSVETFISHRIIKESCVDMSIMCAVSGGVLQVYFGDESSITVGEGDGITAVGKGALTNIKDVTIGRDVVSFEGIIYNDNIIQEQYTITFEGECPTNTEADGIFIYADSYQLRINIYPENISSFSDRLSRTYEMNIDFVTDEQMLIYNNKLLRYYGSSAVVELPDGLDGIYSYAFGRDSHVTDIYFNKIIESFTISSIFDGFNYNSTLGTTSNSQMNVYLPAGAAYFPYISVERKTYDESAFTLNVFVENVNDELNYYKELYQYDKSVNVIEWRML